MLRLMAELAAFTNQPSLARFTLPQLLRRRRRHYVYEHEMNEIAAFIEGVSEANLRLKKVPYVPGQTLPGDTERRRKPPPARGSSRLGWRCPGTNIPPRCSVLKSRRRTAFKEWRRPRRVLKSGGAHALAFIRADSVLGEVVASQPVEDAVDPDRDS